MLRYFSMAAVLLLMSTSVFAQGVSYSYIQALYADVDIDVGPFDADGDGWIVAGSVPIDDDWYVFADYGSASFDFGVDLDRFSVGAGYHAPISSQTDWYAALSYEDLSASAPGVSSASDDGFGLEGGLRSMISPTFELKGSISYADYGDDDDTALNVAGWFTISGNFALGLEASFGDTISTYGIGGRLYFDR
ncbi:MAG: outer membrane beta-barrel protein [Pseudomonadota bacterium]